MGKIEHEWFYTAPLERFGERRGDPLGFRPIADGIADALVPGLSNGTQDGRWLTIVCWILRLVQPNVRNCGSSKKDREEAYKWVRPGELLWVAAALTHDSGNNESSRWLPQKTAVKRWIAGQSLDRFGLSTDAWNRYRFAGPYGTWRTFLRQSGITLLDGFILADGLGDSLADILDNIMAKKRVTPSKPFEKASQRIPEKSWIQRFANWKELPAETLPTDRKNPKKLPEAKLLETILFDKKNTDTKAGIRRKVLEEIKKPGMNKLVHHDLAGHLCDRCTNIHHVAKFTRFCDAGIRAITTLINAANEDHMPDHTVSYEKVVARVDVKKALNVFAREARYWMNLKEADNNRYAQVRDLAKSVCTAGSNPANIARTLIDHHTSHHQGRHWLQSAGKEHFRLIEAGDSG
ncbi:MAG: hypothetical protein A2V87_07525 [Deltaproteobacteria bacterium RBG_16_58_17]|nr:MAG: hypothetical protein A2V87_07525 [Deltaproteobacteria bacterium RBG_16_58_17]